MAIKNSLLLALAILSGFSLGFPGGNWKASIAEIKARAAAPITSPDDSNELIGDLLSPGPTTSVGQAVADIILGKADGQSNDGNYVAPQLGTPQCQQDACCVWKYAVDDMVSTFAGASGRCNLYARGAVRLGFHDAAGWKKGMTYGGADGSMILTDEISRPINKGLEEIVDQMRTWYTKYQPYGAGAADLIQMGANVATVVCPLGPRIRSFVGRNDNAQLPPDGLLPDVNASADSLIQLFEDKSIKPHGLVALVGAHTTSQQRFFEPQKAFDPQDTTPGVWDVLFYSQTLNHQTPQRVVKFPSDVLFSTHPRCSDEWDAFTDPKTGQQHWNDDFAKEYVRLSMLGVNNINALTECTKVLPPQTGTTFAPPDASQVNQWLTGGFSNYGQTVGQLLNSGQQVTNSSLKSNGINPQDATIHSPPAPNSPFNKPPPKPAPVKVPPPHPVSPVSPLKGSPSSINRPSQPSALTSIVESGSPKSQSHQSQAIVTSLERPQPTNSPGREIGGSQGGNKSIINTSNAINPPSKPTGASRFSSAASPISPTRSVDSGIPEPSHSITQLSGSGAAPTHPGTQINNSQQSFETNSASQIERTQDGNTEPKATVPVGSPNSVQQPSEPTKSQEINSNGQQRQSPQSQAPQFSRSVVPVQPSKSAQPSVEQPAGTPAPESKQAPAMPRQSQTIKQPESAAPAKESQQASAPPEQSQVVKQPPSPAPAKESQQVSASPKQSQAVKQPPAAAPAKESQQASAPPKQSQAVKQPPSPAPAKESQQVSASPKQSQAAKQPPAAAPVKESQQASAPPKQSQAVKQPPSPAPAKESQQASSPPKQSQAAKQPQSATQAKKPKRQR